MAAQILALPAMLHHLHQLLPGMHVIAQSPHWSALHQSLTVRTQLSRAELAMLLSLTFSWMPQPFLDAGRLQLAAVVML